jgi:predicted nuclease of predicted toxin-antitoxin system
VPDPIKLYLDEDTINRALIKALRARNVDVVTAREANLIQTPDQEHLAYASSLNRTVLTFNARDFVRLHIEYLSTGRHHAGIIVSNQVQVGVIVRRLLTLLDARSSTEMRDWLEYLSNWR